jgi:hypothetical protein
VTSTPWQQIPAPVSLTVLYADAGLEFPPLQAAALQLLRDVEARGFQTRIVRPPVCST